MGELIDIIQPEVIITLGENTFNAMSCIDGMKLELECEKAIELEDMKKKLKKEKSMELKQVKMILQTLI